MAARCLLLSFLLLNTRSFCYSMTLDGISKELKGERRSIEKIATGFMSMFSLLASDYLTCEEGWSRFRSSCYMISDDIANWEQSLENCQTSNADFVKITHDDEYNFLKNLVNDSNVYVGLSDTKKEGIFRWADGSIQPRIESWWFEGEPNNNGGIGEAENCVHFDLRGDNNRLNDIICSNEYRYICEKPALPQ